MNDIKFNRDLIYTSMKVFQGLYCYESGDKYFYKKMCERYNVSGINGFVNITANNYNNNNSYLNIGYVWEDRFSSLLKEELLEIIFKKLEYEKLLG